MRTRLAIVALLGAAFIPAAPASADCNVALYLLTGQCANPCTVVRDAYYAARAASGDLLPYIEFTCPA